MNFRASSRFRFIDPVTLANRYIPVLSKAVHEGCVAVAIEAKALCPVDTGELEASIHTSAVEFYGGMLTGSVIADAPHSQFVEFGTGLRGSGTYPWPLPESGVPITGSWIHTARLSTPIRIRDCEPPKPSLCRHRNSFGYQVNSHNSDDLGGNRLRTQTFRPS